MDWSSGGRQRDYKLSSLYTTATEVPPNPTDLSIAERLLTECASHKSNSTYSMLALWKKGSKTLRGSNNTMKPATPKADWYPWFCGMHAELDLVHKARADIVGGTLYVLGIVAHNGNTMQTTFPCWRCQKLFTSGQLRPRKLVTLIDGELKKFVFNAYVIKEK